MPIGVQWFVIVFVGIYVSILMVITLIHFTLDLIKLFKDGFIQIETTVETKVEPVQES